MKKNKRHAIRITPSWFLYAGMGAGLSKMEVLCSLPGEIQELTAWKAISNGAKQRIKLTYDEVMELK